MAVRSDGGLRRRLAAWWSASKTAKSGGSACSRFRCTIGARSTAPSARDPRRALAVGLATRPPHAAAIGTCSNCGGRAAPAPTRPRSAAQCAPPVFMPTRQYGTARTSLILTGTGSRIGARARGAWLRRFRHDRAETRRARRNLVSSLSADAARAHDDDSPRWDLYDACEQIARRSWQGAATDGTTLSHESIRGFLRDAHEAAAAAGAVDLNLLMRRRCARGIRLWLSLRRLCLWAAARLRRSAVPRGAGNVLLAYTLRDSFARGDWMYDMGVGSLASKRHFQTRRAARSCASATSRRYRCAGSYCGKAMVAGPAAFYVAGTLRVP